MKIEITKGVGTLKTEDKKELAILMQIYGKFEELGDKMFDVTERIVYKTADAKSIKQEEKDGKRLSYTRTCRVDGCSNKARGASGIQIHMLRDHGIMKSGEQVTFWKFKGKNMPIPHPVMIKGNGYAVLPPLGTPKTGWMKPSQLLPDVEEVKQATTTSSKQPLSL